jgi:hypothetical protein
MDPAIVGKRIMVAAANSKREDKMKQWDDNLKILESIANSYDKNSVQYKALEEAAQAFMFLNLHKELKSAYEKFRMQSDKELGEAQKQHLREMGVQPED